MRCMRVVSYMLPPPPSTRPAWRVAQMGRWLYRKAFISQSVLSIFVISIRTQLANPPDAFLGRVEGVFVPFSLTLRVLHFLCTGEDAIDFPAELSWVQVPPSHGRKLAVTAMRRKN